MPPLSVFPAYDRALGGKLVEILREHRANGLSFDAIALRIYQDFDISADPDTWRRWHALYVVENADA